jgi:hypothetical protein
MNPTMSNGATPPCEGGIFAGAGGTSGFCAHAALAISNNAEIAAAIIFFPEVCNLNNI